MFILKNILRYGWYEYRKRFREPKIYVVILFLTFFLNITIRPLKITAEILNVSIPFGTSFLFMTNGYIYTVVGIALTVFMSDIIKTGNDITDVKMRVNVKTEFFGKAILVFLLSITFTFIFFAEHLLLTVKYICFHNDWEAIGYTLSKTDMSEQMEGLIQFPYYVINEFSIHEAVLYEIGVIFLLCLLAGFIMLALNKMKKGFGGIIILFLLVFAANTIEDSLNVSLIKISPFSWLSLCNVTKVSEPFLPRMQDIFSSLLILILIMLAAGYFMNVFLIQRIKTRRENKVNG